MMPQRDQRGSVQRRRTKLQPDPAVHAAILDAGVHVVREDGVAALNLNELLARTSLSTRAFYRHFESMDHLIQAVFLHVARSETTRLRRRMSTTANPIEAVCCWIDARLDLAFGGPNTSGLRHFSREAQSLIFASPDRVGAAFVEMLQPLVEELERGVEANLFRDIDPTAEAESIHGVVWACTHRHWNTGDGLGVPVRRQAKRFCLRGLGVPADVITSLLDDDPGPADPTS